MSAGVSPRAVRVVVLGVCVVGIAGMIIGSINDNNGAALTFGLLTTAAIVCLLVATAVTRAAQPAGPAGTVVPVDDAQAARVEELVTELALEGADEQALRTLVGEAVRLGRRETS